MQESIDHLEIISLLKLELKSTLQMLRSVKRLMIVIDRQHHCPHFANVTTRLAKQIPIQSQV